MYMRLKNLQWRMGFVFPCWGGRSRLCGFVQTSVLKLKIVGCGCSIQAHPLIPGLAFDAQQFVSFGGWDVLNCIFFYLCLVQGISRLRPSEVRHRLPITGQNMTRWHNSRVLSIYLPY